MYSYPEKTTYVRKDLVQPIDIEVSQLEDREDVSKRTWTPSSPSHTHCFLHLAIYHLMTHIIPGDYKVSFPKLNSL